MTEKYQQILHGLGILTPIPLYFVQFFKKKTDGKQFVVPISENFANNYLMRPTKAVPGSKKSFAYNDYIGLFYLEEHWKV